MTEQTETETKKKGFTRRTAMKAGAATLGAAAFARALAPLTEWEPTTSVDDFLQKHYTELSDEEMQQVLRRLEKETKEEYGADVHIEDVKPQDGVKYAYALNLSTRIGCRKCAEDCHKENNRPRDQ